MVNYETLRSFVKYNIEKFKEEAQCVKHAGGNGRHLKSGRIVARVKSLMLNKKRRSRRTVAAKVRNIIRKARAKPYHKRR